VGFTVLLPVPSDLPVFVKLAIENISHQKSKSLEDVIVIPDHYTAAIDETVRRTADAVGLASCRVLRMPPKDQWFARSSNFVHFMQIATGLAKVGTSHALLHDADLFMFDEGFLEKHFETCRQGDYAALGIDWRENIGPEKKKVAATWELMLNTRWARSFNRYRHRKHGIEVEGKTYGFDTLLFAQWMSPNEKIDVSNSGDYCHLNFTIATFRRYSNRRSVFPDWQYKLLLLKLCILEYDDSGYDYKLPSKEEFLMALTGKSNKLTYAIDKAKDYYPNFKRRLEYLIQKKVLTTKGIDPMREVIDAFDNQLLC
jgi:hypothetical protein